VRFQFAAPDGLDYAVNRYCREAERHYRVLDSHLAGRDYIVGSGYTIVDMSAWCWIDRVSRVMKAQTIPWRRSQASSGGSPRSIGAPRSRGRAVGKDPEFKKVNDEKTKRAPFPAELRRDRQLGRSRVSSRRSCGNGNDNSTAFPNAWHET
jgi:GST-like protein